VWLALADNYLNGLCIDWEKTKTLAFNRKSNPDDNKLDQQIVKVSMTCSILLCCLTASQRCWANVDKLHRQILQSGAKLTSE
jgi:hypothetical protein